MTLGCPEFTARLVEATIRLNALGDHGAGHPWRSALAVVGALQAFSDTGESLTPTSALRYLTLADANPGSIRSCIAVARDNARAARTARVGRRTRGETTRRWRTAERTHVE